MYGNILYLSNEKSANKLIASKHKEVMVVVINNKIVNRIIIKYIISNNKECTYIDLNYHIYYII